jgi:hypothetical protein
MWALLAPHFCDGLLVVFYSLKDPFYARIKRTITAPDGCAFAVLRFLVRETPSLNEAGSFTLCKSHESLRMIGKL